MSNHPSRASNYAIWNATPGMPGYITARDDVHFSELNDAIIYASKSDAQAALRDQESRFEGHRLRLVAVAYQAQVYHGAQHRGLGRWASGRCFADRDMAVADGAKLADQARRVVGGDPVVEIETVARR